MRRRYAVAQAWLAPCPIDRHCPTITNQRQLWSALRCDRFWADFSRSMAIVDGHA
jgi:hypothetical protein